MIVHTNHPDGKELINIDRFSEIQEPLSYILLYPHGNTGYHFEFNAQDQIKITEDGTPMRTKKHHYAIIPATNKHLELHDKEQFQSIL